MPATFCLLLHRHSLVIPETPVKHSRFVKPQYFLTRASTTKLLERVKPVLGGPHIKQTRS